MPGKPYRVGRSKTGLGLFATEPIKKYSLIVEYKGPRVLEPEADRREASGNKYLYQINAKWTIDGAQRGNVARYCNHSCRPNAESDVVRNLPGRSGKRGGRVIVRAIRNIKPGEEITYDYGNDYFNLILKRIGCKCGKCPPWRRKKKARRKTQH